MTPTRPTPFWFFPATCIILAALAGCSSTYDLKLTPVTSYSAARPKINLNVALHLTPQFTHYVAAHEFNSGQTNKLPIGPALADNAQRVTRSVFTTVTVHQDPQSPDPHANAILTPRVINFEGTMLRPLGFFAKNHQILTVEWTLTNPQGQIIWIGTVQGKGEAEVPVTAFEVQDMHTKQMQMLMEDLFRNTYNALTTAPEILRLAPAPNHR